MPLPDLLDRATRGPQRRVRRRLAEQVALERLAAGVPSRRRSRELSPGHVAVALGLTALVCSITAAAYVGPVDGWPLPVHTATLIDGKPVPAPPTDQAETPLGSPPPAPALAASTSVKFMSLRPDGKPVTYDPCRPIHYVLRGEGAPVGADQSVHAAVAQVSAATGLHFIYDGPTDEAPASRRDSAQPDRYGDRWAPVLLAWSDPKETPGLAGDVVGLSGSTAAQLPGQDAPHYVTGQVILDGEGLTRLTRTETGKARVQAVVAHELAHLVGLDHVADRTQLMYPRSTEVTTFGAGDRAGLAALGSGKCYPEG